MTRKNIPEAALAKLEQLAEDAEKMDKLTRSAESSQHGTSIPNHFFAQDTFTVNPSEISVGMLIKMVETDETLFSAVQFKILMLVSKIGEYEHEKKDIEEFVQNFLKRLRRPSWIETVESMASAYLAGFSVSEIVWGYNNDMQKVPVRIPTYHPQTIAFETDRNGMITDDGVLQFVQQTNYQNGNPNERLPRVGRRSKITNPFVTPDDNAMPIRLPFFNDWGMVRIPRSKVVHIINNQFLAFGSPYGRSAVRTAHLAWQMKVFFIKYLGVAAKKNGVPTIIGQAPRQGVMVEMESPNGKVEQLTPQEALIKMLRDRESNDSVVIGSEEDGYKITVVNNNANLDQFTNVINLMNVLIFRAFLMPSLIMTDGSSGSRSLGDKHFDIVNRLAEVDAQKFTGAIINDLIEQAIVDNYGPQDDYGKFKQRPASLEELEKLSNIFASLTTDGYMSSAEETDRNHVRESMGLPEDKGTLFGLEEDDDLGGEE